MKDIILAGHDWDGVLGFYYALNRRENIKGIHFIQEDNPVGIATEIIEWGKKHKFSRFIKFETRNPKQIQITRI